MWFFNSIASQVGSVTWSQFKDVTELWRELKLLIRVETRILHLFPVYVCKCGEYT
jgi:hypothetical protein